MSVPLSCPACSHLVRGASALCAACRLAYHAACWKAEGCIACGCAKEPIAVTFGRREKVTGWVLAAIVTMVTAIATPFVLTGQQFLSLFTAEGLKARDARPVVATAGQPPSHAARNVPPGETRRAFQLFEDPQPEYAEVEAGLAGLRERPAPPPTTSRVQAVPVDSLRDEVKLPPFRALSGQRISQVEVLLEAPGLRAREYEMLVGPVVHPRPGRLAFLQVSATAEPSKDGLPAASASWTVVAVRALAHMPAQRLRFALPMKTRALRFVLVGDVDVDLSDLHPAPDVGALDEVPLVATAFDPLIGVGLDLLADGTLVLFARVERGESEQRFLRDSVTFPTMDAGELNPDRDPAAFREALRAHLGRGTGWQGAFTGVAVPAAEAPWRAGLSAEAGFQRLTEFLRSFALPRMRIAKSRRGSAQDRAAQRFIEGVRLETPASYSAKINRHR